MKPSDASSLARLQHSAPLGRRIRKNWDIYLMALPGLLFLIFFSYFPMYGIQIAFRNYKVVKGIWGSSWVGLKQFEQLVRSNDFMRAFRNTFILSGLHIAFSLPFPILVALLLNELRCTAYKRVLQTVSYVPHFISWIVVAGIFSNILSPSTGIVNQLIKALGGDPIYFLTNRGWIRAVVVFTDVWKEFGWNTIIYLAALTATDQSLYEAAAIDGAGRFRQVLHVSLPAISGTIVVMVIMALGNIMTGASFDQIFALYNTQTYERIDIISTFVYRVTFTKFNYSFTTAAGLFQSVIGCFFLVTANTVCKRFFNRSMY